MTSHLCTFEVDVTCFGDEAATFILAKEWREGKAKDCEVCKARRQPRTVKRGAES
jgi:hypothetical protein